MKRTKDTFLEQREEETMKGMHDQNHEEYWEIEEREIKTCDYCGHEMYADEGSFCSKDCATGYQSDIT